MSLYIITTHHCYPSSQHHYTQAYCMMSYVAIHTYTHVHILHDIPCLHIPLSTCCYALHNQHCMYGTWCYKTIALHVIGMLCLGNFASIMSQGYCKNIGEYHELLLWKIQNCFEQNVINAQEHKSALEVGTLDWMCI